MSTYDPCALIFYIGVLFSKKIFSNWSLIVYKTVYSGQPQDLKSILISQTYYSTRSSDYNCLLIPRTRTVLGKRAFTGAGSTFWNSLPVSLPVSVHSTRSLVSFCSQLKT